MCAGFDEMRCCRMQRADQRVDRATAFIEHGLAHREHLFDATAPDLRGCERNMADTAIDRDRIPRLADAYAIDLARRERVGRSEEHTSELQSLMRNSYAVFCLKK